MLGPSTSSDAATAASAAPRWAPAPRHERSRRRPSRATLALASLAALLLLTATAAAQSPDAGTAVSAAYAAWADSDYEQARDLAREAIALDDGVPTLVARKVLVLALQKLGEPAEALAELQQYLAFDLLPADRQWAEQTEAALRGELPDDLADDPPDDPVVEPTDDPVTEPTDDPIEPAPGGGVVVTPAPTTPRLLLAAGGGFQQLGPWSYGAVWVDGSVGLVGPLRVGVGWQGGAAPNPRCAEGSDCLAFFNSIDVGIRLRAAGAVASPWAEVGFLLGVNGGGSPYRVAVPGVTAGGGVELGEEAVAFRLRGAFRLLGPLDDGEGVRAGFLAGIDLALRLGEVPR